MRQSWMSFVLVSLVASGCDAPPTADSTAEASNLVLDRAAPALAFPPTADAYGTSLAEWSKAWWRWELSIPTAVNPSLDPTGANCAEGQEGRVWYLGALFTSGTVERGCSVPAGKAILIALSSLLNDFPCPDPNFKPAPGQSLEDFLAEGARQVEDRVNQLSLTVDGAAVPDLFDRRVATGLFEFTGDISLKTSIDGCITGSPQPAVSDGFFVLLKPLSQGEHTIAFGAATPSFQSSLIYHIDVVPEE
jgi:hypothetical protein